MEYGEIQANEVEALRAIYTSDFKELPNGSVWNQKPCPKFVIDLRPSSEFESSPMKVQLQVTMTQTYPKTLPKVELLNSTALSGRQMETLKSCVDRTLKELKGSEMIFEVTSNVQYQLDEWARSVSEAAPNLEEDRLRRLRLEERKQKETQDQIQREREAFAMQEEQKYDNLVLEELKKSETMEDQSFSNELDPRDLIILPETAPGVTTFERVIELPQAFCDQGEKVAFRQVLAGLRVKQAFYGESYIAKAVLPEDSVKERGNLNTAVVKSVKNRADVALLITKVGFSSEFWRTASGARLLHDLNTELSLIRGFRHPGVVPLCEFMIERFYGRAPGWELSILTPLSRLMPLSSLIENTDSVHLKTAQRWSFQILEALESLHKAGLRHRCLCPENTMVNVDPETGESSMMLRHPQYLYTLHHLNEAHPFEAKNNNGSLSSGFVLDVGYQWIPPEGRGRGREPVVNPSSKWDIWQFGAILALMVAGKRELMNFKGDIDTYVRSKPRNWPSDLTDLLLSVLHPDPARRPSALELLTDQFFRSDFEMHIDEFDFGNNALDAGLSAKHHPAYNPLPASSTSTLIPKGENAHTMLGGGGNDGGAAGNGGHEPNAEGSFGRRRLSSNEETNTFSRYKQDFDEGIVLGRGGFGQVVKARNKLDGRVYAVKKIRATPSTLSHILQEVVLLSRLNHQYVVRYYTVWLEDESENVDTSFDDEIETGASRSRSLLRESYSGASRDPNNNAHVNIMDAISSASLSKFSLQHSLSEIDLPSVSNDFMSESGFVEFGFSDSDEEALVDVGDHEGKGSLAAAAEEEDEESESTSEASTVPSRGFQSLGNRNRFSTSPDALARNNRNNNINNIRKRDKLMTRLSRITHKTLYIQMEYCENHTLGDLIKQNLCKNPAEYWRLLRQILEALAYIHGEGVIHRDLKPKNIFIDQARNIKIGDFGLARSMVQPLQSRQESIELPNTPLSTPSPGEGSTNIDDEDLTTDVGTSLYSAVEITTSNYPKHGYNEKVDIFSLGIILFEMVWGMGTEMERIQNIKRARAPQIELPPQLENSKPLRLQVELIKSMLNHNPSKRPSALGLLKSGKIPVEEQDMTVQEALRNVRDPTIVQQLVNALFSRPLISAQQVLYDRTNHSTVLNRRQQLAVNDPMKILTINHVEKILTSVFRSHGAIDNSSFRSHLFPRSTFYKGPTVVELLDSQGTVLQLPHDLTLPHARRLAEVVPEYSKSYAIDTVFRVRLQNPGIHPTKHTEVDFDITSVDESEDSLIYDEAEAIGVMYDSANLTLGSNGDSASAYNEDGFGSSAFRTESEENGLAVVVGHHDILSAILSHCGLSPPQYFAALSLISTGSLDRRSNVLMRSNISTASLELLSQFGFKEPLEQADYRLSRLMPLSESVRRGLARVKTVAEVFKRICATHKDPQIYFSPLVHSATSEFYLNGTIFQLIETKSSASPSRQAGLESVLAVGGRYDSLVKSFRNSVLDSRTQLVKAVGFGLSADKLAALVVKKQVAQQQQSQSQSLSRSIVPPRCRVLVSSLSETSLKTQGLDAVRLLWRHGINADIVRNVVSTDDLMACAAKENAMLVIIVRQMHALSSTNNKFKPFKVKPLVANGAHSHGDADLAFSELIPYVQNELGMSSGSGSGSVNAFGDTDIYGSGHPDGSSLSDTDSANDRVIILNESGKLKGGRKNKWQLEERSVEARGAFLSELRTAPLISLDLRDDIIAAITTISPHAIEEWKRRVVGLSPNQKAYIMTIQAKLSNEAMKSPRLILFSSKTEKVFIYQY